LFVIAEQSNIPLYCRSYLCNIIPIYSILIFLAL
jgi:hypothetical protein